MIPLRKFVILLFILSVLPATVILIWVKMMVGSLHENQNKKSIQSANSTQILRPTAIPTVSEIRQIPLKVLAPVNGTTVFVPEVIVKGISVPYGSIFINEASGSADTDGNFALNVPLIFGENHIYISAKDEMGRYSEIEIRVIYKLDN